MQRAGAAVIVLVVVVVVVMIILVVVIALQGCTRAITHPLCAFPILLWTTSYPKFRYPWTDRWFIWVWGWGDQEHRSIKRAICRRCLSLRLNPALLLQHQSHSHSHLLQVISRLVDLSVKPPNSNTCNIRYVMFGTPLQVFKKSFWMRKYKSISFKRTTLWSNSASVGLFDLGKLTPTERRNTEPTTMKWTDKHGKKRYKGNSKLKSTQTLACVNPTLCSLC